MNLVVVSILFFFVVSSHATVSKNFEESTIEKIPNDKQNLIVVLSQRNHALLEKTQQTIEATVDTLKSLVFHLYFVDMDEMKKQNPESPQDKKNKIYAILASKSAGSLTFIFEDNTTVHEIYELCLFHFVEPSMFKPVHKFIGAPNDKDFHEIATKNDKPVFVLFTTQNTTASAVKISFTKMASTYYFNVIYAEMDCTDESNPTGINETCRTFGVTTFPTLIGYDSVHKHNYDGPLYPQAHLLFLQKFDVSFLRKKDAKSSSTQQSSSSESDLEKRIERIEKLVEKVANKFA